MKRRKTSYFIISAVCFFLSLFFPIRAGAESTGPAETPGAFQGIVLKRDEGAGVLLKRDHVLAVNTAVTFLSGSETTEDYEYCVSADAGKTFSAFEPLADGSFRLEARDNNPAAGLWLVRFRRINCEKEPDPDFYGVCFDLTPPDIVVSENRTEDGRIRFDMTVSDDRSGMKYLEIRDGEEVIVKSNFLQRNKRESGGTFCADTALLRQQMVFEADPTRLHGETLSVLLMDRAGNTTLHEQSLPDTPLSAEEKHLSALLKKLKIGLAFIGKVL
ncbi:MAG: hypothetical protein K6G83_01895 [Lachnospiraceae bacterium]|nr:hypothetical protein [Lachnospiraceae bacterium]